MTFEILSWPMLAIALLIFGFMPGAVLRLIVLAFPRDSPRRHELRGELQAVSRFERPFWVAEQLELALFEGLGDRFAFWRIRRIAKTSELDWIDGGIDVAFFRGKVLLRKQGDSNGPVLIFSESQWRNTVKAVRRGDFDAFLGEPALNFFVGTEGLGVEVPREPNQWPSKAQMPETVPRSDRCSRRRRRRPSPRHGKPHS